MARLPIRRGQTLPTRGLPWASISQPAENAGRHQPVASGSVFLEGPAALSTTMVASVGLRPLRVLLFHTNLLHANFKLARPPSSLTLQPPVSHSTSSAHLDLLAPFLLEPARLARLRGRDPDSESLLLSLIALFSASQSALAGLSLRRVLRKSRPFRCCNSACPHTHSHTPPAAGPLLRVGPSLN